MATHLPQNQFISNSTSDVLADVGSGAAAMPPLPAAPVAIEDRLDWRAFWEFVMDDRVVLLSDEVPLFLRDA